MVRLAATSFGHTDCERIVGGTLAQPVLALTSLAYVAAGAWALRTGPGRRDPLTRGAALALAAVGFGSVAYHGPQPTWAEKVHDLPIYALAVTLVAGSAVRRPPRQAWRLPSAWFGAALVAGACPSSSGPGRRLLVRTTSPGRSPGSSVAMC